jgi:hypothetical protein
MVDEPRLSGSQGSKPHYELWCSVGTLVDGPVCSHSIPRGGDGSIARWRRLIASRIDAEKSDGCRGEELNDSAFGDGAERLSEVKARRWQSKKGSRSVDAESLSRGGPENSLV